MNKRTADRLHKAAVAKGRVVPFYKPQPKPAAPVELPEVVEAISAADILREALENADGLREIVIIMRDKQGIGGLVSNMDGAGESFLFMEQVKFEMIQRMRQPQPPTKGPEPA
jgi:hypothetical protein